jgi:putative colanic acid biosynthesis acetyltransferase WcaF
MKVDLSKYNNTWYKPGNALLIALWLIVSFIVFRPSLPLASSSIKVRILKLFGSKISDNVILKPSIIIKYPWNLKIGKNSWIGENVWIDNLDMVTIGENCCISQGAYLLTGNHDYNKESFDLLISPILLENAAWVGAQSIVCPGVTLKEGSILTAGSVATKNMDEYCIYQGNPAVKIKERIFV